MDVYNGDLSASRFSYRTIGSGIAIAAGTLVTGGVGFLAGATISLGEVAFDTSVDIGKRVKVELGRFSSSLNNGWRPSR